jgi:hypothetical protein
MNRATHLKSFEHTCNRETGAEAPVVAVYRRLVNQAPGEWIAIGLAAGNAYRRANRQHNCADREDDEQRDADEDEAQKDADKTPDEDIELEVERLFRLVLHERRVGNAHDDHRHENVHKQ